MKSFLSFLSESKDMLDISILSADKYLTSSKKIHEFLFDPVTIEAKTDGIKLTVLKVQDTGTIDDYIFSYKNNILYLDEFNYNPLVKIEKESIGASQFKLVFNHFSKLGKNSIPVNTELQIEYLMSKPTLSSNYEKKHGMVLIGYSKSSYVAEFGKLKTKNSGMQTEKRDLYAKELQLNTPLKLFNGILGTEQTFNQGILNDTLKNLFQQVRNTLDFNDEETLYSKLKGLFLEIPSKFGGKEEGVVLKFKDKILKWQQDYQLDQTARGVIKQKFKEDDVSLEETYWKNVRRVAMELTLNSREQNINLALAELSTKLKYYKLDFTHSKKTDTMIRDDIQLTAKTLLLKSLKGNNGCLILGKFRVFTNGHYELLKRASKEYDRVCICLVSSKDTKDTRDLRFKMLSQVVQKFKNVEIIENANGNILGIFSKCDFNINTVYAGTDRIADYQRQIQKLVGVNVRELQRDNSSISATKVIENISDFSFFKKNTPKEIHSMYEEILKVYGNIKS